MLRMLEVIIYKVTSEEAKNKIRLAAAKRRKLGLKRKPSLPMSFETKKKISVALKKRIFIKDKRGLFYRRGYLI